jgi:exodeoxyribonuclease VII large subunit
VGHEVDVTLSDLAADARALTPTNAAEVGLPSAGEIAGYLAQAQMRMTTCLHARVRHLQQRVQQLSTCRAIARPQELIHMRRQMLDEWDGRARTAMWQLMRQHRQRVEGLARAAHALSPLQVLARGYSLTSRADDGELIRDANDVVNGDRITTVLQRGTIISEVIKKV